MKVFISGGSGTLGSALTKHYQLEDRCVIYSRTEGRQAEMAIQYPEGGPTGVRYMLGCVSDYRRICEAMEGADLVIHAAAQKMIDSCEYNVYESTKTNVLGTENIARACVQCKVKQAIFVSSDKACNPVSAYGAQKYLGEKIWINSNHYGPCRFNLVRYGNVRGSAKSAFYAWQRQVDDGLPVTVTHPEATRFFWEIDEAAQFIYDISMENTKERGCIYIPKMKSYKILDIARKYSEDIKITGFRCPEKVHEELVSETESENCYDCGKYYVIYPVYHEWCSIISKRGEQIKHGISSSLA